MRRSAALPSWAEMKRPREPGECVRLLCRNARHAFAIDRPFWALPKLLQVAFERLPKEGETPVERSFYDLMSILDIEAHEEEIKAALEGREYTLDDFLKTCVQAVVAFATDPEYSDVLVVVEDRLRLSLDAVPMLAQCQPRWRNSMQPVPSLCVDLSDLL